MKTKILIAIGCSLLIASASAQYSVVTDLARLGGSNEVITASAVSNYTALPALNVSRTRYVGAQLSFRTTNNVTGNAVAVLQRSFDNTNFTTIATLTASGTSTNYFFAETNMLDIGMAQYFRVGWITNNIAYLLTNVQCLGIFKATIAQTPYDAIGFEPMPASLQLTNWSLTEISDVQPASLALTNWGELSTNVTIDLTTSSSPTGQFSADLVYTNLPARTLLTGAAILKAAAGGDAAIILRYTNNGIGYTLPMSVGQGAAQTNAIPFSVPLATNATFKFETSFGTGASGYLTNTINWRF